MNTSTIEKLQELAPAIERFRNLSLFGAKWLSLADVNQAAGRFL